MQTHLLLRSQETGQRALAGGKRPAAVSLGWRGLPAGIPTPGTSWEMGSAGFHAALLLVSAATMPTL